jgi:hypothetical protein
MISIFIEINNKTISQIHWGWVWVINEINIDIDNGIIWTLRTNIEITGVYTLTIWDFCLTKLAYMCHENIIVILVLAIKLSRLISIILSKV